MYFGYAFIFVHGAGGSAWVWNCKVAGLLRERGHVAVALDLPGHGASAAPCALWKIRV